MKRANETRERRNARSKGRHGLSLLEIVIAVFILAMVAFPFVRGVSSSAKHIENTEKAQMARKIHQSVKEELMSVPFREFVEYADKIGAEPAEGYPLDSFFYPNSLTEVEKYQQKYRDFRLDGIFRFIARQGRDPKERAMILVTLDVTWDQPGKGKERSSTGLTLINQDF